MTDPLADARDARRALAQVGETPEWVRYRRALTALAATYDEATADADLYRQAAEVAANRRAIALYALHETSGKSYSQLAAELGISSPRVGQLVGRGRELFETEAQ